MICGSARIFVFCKLLRQRRRSFLVEINFDIRFPSNQHKRMRRRAVEARQSTLDLVLGLLGAVSRSDIDSTPGGERS